MGFFERKWRWMCVAGFLVGVALCSLGFRGLGVGIALTAAVMYD
jgi:hypothetical protein